MNADIILRLSMLGIPLAVAAASIASSRRRSLVPMVLFGIGLAAIAGWRLVLHDFAQHEHWHLFAFPTLLALPPLAAWQMYRLARARPSTTLLSTGDGRWILIALITGIAGTWAAWATISRGIP